MKTAGKLWRTNMFDRTKFQQNRQDGFKNIAIFSIFKMATILDFEILKFLVYHHIGWPNMHRCTKFQQNRSNG